MSGKNLPSSNEPLLLVDVNQVVFVVEANPFFLKTETNPTRTTNRTRDEHREWTRQAVGYGCNCCIHVNVRPSLGALRERMLSKFGLAWDVELLVLIGQKRPLHPYFGMTFGAWLFHPLTVVFSGSLHSATIAPVHPSLFAHEIRTSRRLVPAHFKT